MSTFLGMPVFAPRGVGNLRGDEPFPAAARKALGNDQLRRNLGHATTTIRKKSGAVIGELPDWQELRSAGSALKAETMARLPELLLQLEENVTKAEVCTAGDSSCLMHIGGGLSRLDAGVRTVHLAEILAATEASS